MEKNSLFSLLSMVSFDKRRIMFATLYSTIQKVCDIIPEVLISLSIDVVVRQKQSDIAQYGIVDPIKQLYLVGGLIALFWLLESLFEYLYSIAWHTISHRVQHELRLHLYSRVQSLDLVYFEKKSSGSLLTLLQDDIEQVGSFVSHGPNEIIQLAANMLILGTVFMYVSPMICGITLLPIPFIAIIAYYFQRQLAQVYSSLRLATSQVANHVIYRLQGIMIIKSYAAEQYELERLRDKSFECKMAQIRANDCSSLYIPCVRTVVMAGFVAALIMGGIATMRGDIPIHMFAVLAFLTQKFLWPFSSLTVITDMYEKSNASAARIIEVLHDRPTIVSGPESVDLDNAHGEITFANVAFDYSEDYAIFKNLNFTIPARTTVAFVGATGSGKSTIVKLLLRLYDAQDGVIAIDGHDIKNIKLHDLRAEIGLVSQEVYIVDGTVADNIAYGTFQATREQIEEAAKMAQAHQFITELTDGYDTVLPEHGKNLSGGQRQRISIARALLKKSPILIFDEATSALDNETEAAIIDSMEQLRKDHTIIIIAHRLTTVRHADTIFVLNKGKIVESGNHEALLLKNGPYAQLLHMEAN